MADFEFRAAGVVDESIVDGPGLRLTVFLQGCPHGCAGCHNPETHDMAGGSVMLLSEIEKKLRKNPLLDGVTLSGGEPFCQPKAARKIAELAVGMGLNVMAYSGFTIEKLLLMAREDEDVYRTLELCKYLVDGPFILAERTLELRFRGSRNQRIIDPREALHSGSAVMTEF